MRSKNFWPVVVLSLVIGIAIGGVGTGAFLIEGAGYRPPAVARVTQSTPTSPPSTSLPTRPTGPSARSAPSIAFDAATGKMVLFGGYVTRGNYHEFGDFVSDTWTWDGAGWTSVPTASGPVERTQAAMAYDSARRVVVLREGTETWSFDGTRWLLLSPKQSPPDPGFIEPMYWDSRQKVVVLLSGAPIQAAFATSSGPLNHVWTWDGSGWTQSASPNLAPDAPPQFPPGGGSYAHAGLAEAAYDPARNVTVYFQHAGGVAATWTFDGVTWDEISTTTGSASVFFALAADDARSEVVMFGENGDTWTWGGSIWTPRNPAHSPPPRREAAMAYDPVHRVVVLFGGHAGSAANLHEFNDTWAWNGSDWTQLA